MANDVAILDRGAWAAIKYRPAPEHRPVSFRGWVKMETEARASIRGSTVFCNTVLRNHSYIIPYFLEQRPGPLFSSPHF